VNFRAAQSPRLADHVAVLDPQLGSQRRQARQM
jgi:hypothetical protein